VREAVLLCGLLSVSTVGCRTLLGIQTLAETDDGGSLDASALDATTDARPSPPNETSNAADASAVDAAAADAAPADSGEESSTNVFLGPPVCAPNGWCFANPRPQGNDLYGLWVTSSSDVWAVGDRETVLHFDGNVWSGAVLATGDNGQMGGTLYGVWADDRQNAWAVGIDSGLSATVLFHDGSADAGPFAWSRVTVPTAGLALYAVWGDPQRQYVLAAGSGAVLRYNRTTLQWTQDTAPSVDIRAIWGSGPTNLWAVGATGAVLNNTGGSTWTQASLGGIPSGQSYYGIWGDPAGSNIWIVGGGGVVIHGNATGWALVPVTAEMLTTNFWAVRGDDGGHVWVAGQSLTLGAVVYEWDGSAWSSALGSQCGIGCAVYAYRAIGGSGASDLWTVGRFGVMAHGDANGWSTPPQASTQSLRGVWSASPSDVWAIGTLGSTLHWDGARWTQVPNIDGGTFTSVWGSGPNDVYAAGNVVAHYDGTAWAAHSQAPDGGISAIWGSGPNDIWAAGAGLVHSLDGGPFVSAPFVSVPLPDGGVLTPIEGLWGSGPNDVWAVGGATGAAGSSDYGYAAHFDGQSWTLDTDVVAAANGDASAGILFGVGGSPSGDLFFAGELAALERPAAQGASTVVLPGLYHSSSTYPGRLVARAANDAWFVGASPVVSYWDGGALSPVVTCMNPHLAMPAIWQDGTQTWMAGARGYILFHP
jgi:hypothetical protein